MDVDSLINLGYTGLFIGTLLAGTVIPFSPDILMIGLMAGGGNIYLCVIVAAVGNWAGGMINYFLGRLAKWEWLEKWFKIKREKIESQKTYVEKYGVWAAFFSWIPFIGALSVIALGVYKVSPLKTALFLFMGCLVRFSVVALLYTFFSEKVMDYVNRKKKVSML